jgi:hypothetical protein
LAKCLPSARNAAAQSQLNKHCRQVRRFCEHFRCLASSDCIETLTFDYCGSFIARPRSSREINLLPVMVAKLRDARERQEIARAQTRRMAHTATELDRRERGCLSISRILCSMKLTLPTIGSA